MAAETGGMAAVAAWRQSGGSGWRQKVRWRQSGGRKIPPGGRVAAVGGCWRQSGGIVAAGGGMVTESLRAAGLQPANSLPALQIRVEGDQDKAGCPCIQMENA